MNKKIKLSIAAICAAAAVCVPLSTAPVLSGEYVPAATLTASAAQTQKSGVCSGSYYEEKAGGYKIYYKTTSSGSVITGCETTKDHTELAIPKRLGSRSVVTVDDNAFKNQTNITGVFFYGIDGPLYTTYTYRGIEFSGKVSYVGGSNVSTIGQSAFEGCTSLNCIHLGDKKMTIKDQAFYGCSALTDVYSNSSAETLLTPSYKEIGSYAFTGTSLKYFTGVTCDTIKDYAFDSCKKLEKLEITADTIGYEAFNGCTNLLYINVVAGKIGGRCFQKCESLNCVKIKADSIGTYCFSRSEWITNAVLDVADIGSYAFSNSIRLWDLTLINTKTIGKHAFEYCSSIKELEIPDTVESIGEFAFYKATGINNPQIFLREDGRRLYIGRAAFNSSGVEYAVFSGDNITVGDYSFFQSRIHAAAVDGNVRIDHNAFGNSETANSGFTLYGTADTNQYAADYGLPYVKVEKGKGYDKLMERIKPYFMGIHAGSFANENGCCAGVAIVQNLTFINKLSMSELFPVPYNDSQITSFLQVPDDAYKARRPEFTKFTQDVYDYWDNQEKYLDSNSQISINCDNIDEYAKLTEYGIPVPCYLKISSHSHAIAFFGVEKLTEPKVFENGIDGSKYTYNYRLIVSENGYRYKTDAKGDLLAKGSDVLTWQEGFTEDEGWRDVDETYIYLSTEPDSPGACYQQRWDYPGNVDQYFKDHGRLPSKTTIQSLRFYPAYTLEYREK